MLMPLMFIDGDNMFNHEYFTPKHMWIEKVGFNNQKTAAKTT